MTTPAFVPAFPNPQPWDGDPAQVAEEARLLLRLNVDDPDVTERLQPLAWAVSDLVREHLARPVAFDDAASTVEIPEPVHQACISALLDAYRRKDTSFSLTGAWSNDGMAMKVSRDWLDPVLTILQPYRAAFGLA